MILISIASHLYEFEENIKALWHKVQIKTDLCDVTLSCEDKQMKIHRLIISSYSYALVPYVKNHSLHINRVA